MFDAAMIEECFRKFSDKNMTQVVIYPYGANGVQVKRVADLVDNIRIVHIIDNKKYNNENIISLNQYKQLYSDDEYVIITIQNPCIEKEMKDELLDFIREERIISLNEYANEYNKSFYLKTLHRLNLRNILPHYDGCKEEKDTSKKIRVRVLFSRIQTYNTIASFCEAIIKDKEMDLLLIIGWDQRKECIDLVESHGYEYCLWQEYDVKEDKPDILVLYMTYDYSTKMPNINEYVKLTIVLCTQLTRNANSIDEFWKVQRLSFGRFKPDYYLCDSLLYKDIMELSNDIPYKIVEMGNPKYDGIYQACKKKEYPIGWGKLKRKKVIFWGPDHGFFDGHISHTTFDLFAKVVFEYFYNNEEMGLIFRPHPDMRQELIQQGYWTTKEYEAFMTYCDESSNIIFDTSETYDSAYSVADAILTDACCGISISALPTRKPICVAYRSELDEAFNEEILCNYYSARSENDIIVFFEMIKNGKDDLLTRREDCIQKCVLNFDGKNGQRVKKFMKDEYLKRCGENRVF